MVLRLLFTGIIALFFGWPAQAQADRKSFSRSKCEVHLTTDNLSSEDLIEEYGSRFALKAAPWLLGASLPLPNFIYDLDRAPSDDLIKARAQEVLNRFQFKNPKTKKLWGNLKRGVTLDSVLVSTHLYKGKLQSEGSRFLTKSEELQNIPKIFLASSAPAFSLADPAFGSLADLVLYSGGGETPVPITSKKVFLMGGFEDACLAKTIKDLISNAIKAGNGELTIVVLTDFVYSRGPFAVPGPFASSFQRATKESDESQLKLALDQSTWIEGFEFDRTVRQGGHLQLQFKNPKSDLNLNVEFR